MFYSINEFYSKETILKCSKFVDLDIDFDNKQFYPNFWVKFLNVFVPVAYSKNKKINDYFEDAFVYKACAESNQHIDFLTAKLINESYPFFSLINDIRLSSWHWYFEENKSIEVKSDIFYRLTHLPTPFNDSRFEAQPVACSFRRGFCDAPWLHDKEGAFVKDFENNSILRASSADNSLFLDAKLAICLFFQNKPSILISFNVNENKQIFIHQIQAQLKDRGHYKLGNDWRSKALDYVKSVFNDYEFYMLDSKHIIDLVLSNYTGYENFKPNEDTIQRIVNEYNSFKLSDETLVKKVFLDKFDFDKLFLYRRMSF